MVDIIVFQEKLHKNIVSFIYELFRVESGEQLRIIIIGRSKNNATLLSQQYVDKLQIIDLDDECNLKLEECLRKSENDIVIITETFIMGNGWLTKLKEFVYNREEFASASPICIRDRIFTMDKMLIFDIASKVRLNHYCYAREPMGVCFYYKRSVIKEILENKTYLLNNDYARSMFEIALGLGYRHVICENVAVILEVDNTESKIDVHSIAEDNLFLNLKLRSDKKNILYILHTGIRNCDSRSLGGIQRHVWDLVTSLKDRYNCFVAWPEDKEIRIVAFCGKEEIEFSFPKLNDVAENMCRDYDTFLIFNRIIETLSIDLIHIHHFKGLNFEPFYSAKEKSIPIILTLHDYYYICPNIFFMYKEKKICELNNRNGCCECLSLRKFKIDFVQRRRKEFKRIVEFCNYIVIPDESLYEIYSNVIGKFHTKTIPNGIERYKGDICCENIVTNNEKKLNVAFIGQIMPTKGSFIALNMIKSNLSDNILWHFFGDISDRELDVFKHKNVTKHGKYKTSDIVNLLKASKIDIVCLPCQVPEAFCYTLSEAWMAGIPVLASDIGALGNRLRKHGGGILVSDYANSKDFLENIYRLNSDRLALNKLKIDVSSINIYTTKEMGIEYEKIYMELLPGNLKRKEITVDYQRLYMAYKDSKFSLVDENNQKIAMLEQYKKELIEIKDSLVYKSFVRVFRLIKPYEKVIISFVYKMLRKF